MPARTSIVAIAQVVVQGGVLLHIYGLYSYGLYGCCICCHGLYSYGLHSYGLDRYSLRLLSEAVWCLYVLIAYIVMAHIATACIAMAYIVMPYSLSVETPIGPAGLYRHTIHSYGLQVVLRGGVVLIHPDACALAAVLSRQILVLRCVAKNPHRLRATLDPDGRASCRIQVPHVALYRLYIGIADAMSIARVWACRYSK